MRPQARPEDWGIGPSSSWRGADQSEKPKAKRRRPQHPWCKVVRCWPLADDVFPNEDCLYQLQQAMGGLEALGGPPPLPKPKVIPRNPNQEECTSVCWTKAGSRVCKKYHKKTFVLRAFDPVVQPECPAAPVTPAPVVPTPPVESKEQREERLLAELALASQQFRGLSGKQCKKTWLSLKGPGYCYLSMAPVRLRALLLVVLKKNPLAYDVSAALTVLGVTSYTGHLVRVGADQLHCYPAHFIGALPQAVTTLSSGDRIGQLSAAAPKSQCIVHPVGLVGSTLQWARLNDGSWRADHVPVIMTPARPYAFPVVSFDPSTLSTVRLPNSPGRHHTRSARKLRAIRTCRPPPQGLVDLSALEDALVHDIDLTKSRVGSALAQVPALNPPGVEPPVASTPARRRPRTWLPRTNRLRYLNQLARERGPACPVSLFFGVHGLPQELLTDALASEWTVPAAKDQSSNSVAPNQGDANKANIGTLHAGFFAHSPQHHAILNGHLADYKKDLQRARMTTPYTVPSKLTSRLSEFGLEVPPVPAEAHPHAFNKNLELRGLRIATLGLEDNGYDMVCSKGYKLAFCPIPKTIQNPLFEAKDLYRFRQQWDSGLTFSSDNIVWHDISSVVGPRELAARLGQTTARFMTVTGVNPCELMERAPSYDPELYTLEYVGNQCMWRPEGSDYGHYQQPIAVTKEWMSTSLVVLPDGRRVHVEMLDYAAGHCVWFLSLVDCPASDLLTFSRRQFIKVPSLIGGSYSPGQRTIPLSLLESLVRFAQRTPDLRWSNLQAKGSQVASTLSPHPSPLQIDVAIRAANYVVGQGASSWFGRLSTFVANVFAFRITNSDEALLNLRDENLVIHRFGRSYRRSVDWGFTNAWTAVRDSRDPAAALALINATVGLLVIPKVIVSETLILLSEHYGSLWNALVTFYGWLDMAWWRAGVISAGVIATSMLPSSTTRYLSAAARAMMEQLDLYSPLSLLARAYQTIFGLGPALRYSGYCFTYQALLTLSGLAVLLPGAFVWWEEPWMMPIALVMGLTGHFPLWLLWRWIPFFTVCLVVDAWRWRCHWMPVVVSILRLPLALLAVVPLLAAALDLAKRLGSLFIISCCWNLIAAILGHLASFQWLWWVATLTVSDLLRGARIAVLAQIRGTYYLHVVARLSLAYALLAIEKLLPLETLRACVSHCPTLFLWPLAIPAAIDTIELSCSLPPPLPFTLAPINFWSGLVVQCFWEPSHPCSVIADWLTPAQLSPGYRLTDQVVHAPIVSTGRVAATLGTYLSRPVALLQLALSHLGSIGSAIGALSTATSCAMTASWVRFSRSAWLNKVLHGCPPTNDPLPQASNTPFLGTRRMPKRQAPSPTPPTPTKPFPTIMTMSNASPVSPVAALRIDSGSYASFNDWASAIATVFQGLPPIALDYGTSCFWVQAGAATGHLPSMWYAVYCAWTNQDPYAGGPNRGKVSETMIQQFCAFTGIGVTMDSSLGTSVVEVMKVAPRLSWPVLNLLLSHLPNGDRHVAHRACLAGFPTAQGALGSSAWNRQIRSDYAASDIARATAAELRTLKALPNLADAIHSTLVVGLPVAGGAGNTPGLFSVTHAAVLIESRIIKANLAQQLTGSICIRNIIAAAPLAPRAVLTPGEIAAVARLPGLADIGTVGGSMVVPYVPTIPQPRFKRYIGQASEAYRRAIKTTVPPVPQNYVRRTPLAESGPLTQREAEGVKVSQPLITRATALIRDMVKLYSRYYGLTLPQQRLSFETVMYTPDLDAARELAADLKAHPSLLEMKDASEITASLDAILKSCDTPVPLPVNIAFGVPGSGKTTLCRQTIGSFSDDRKDQTRIISHNEFIRAALRRDFTMLKRGYNFPTLRHAIAEPSSGDVFIDDGGKLWGGVLDLLMLTNPLVTQWWVNGDPGQGREQIPLPMCQSKHRPSPVHALAPLATQYATISHRVPHAVADAFGFYTTNSNVGFIKVINAPLSGMPYITSSERYVSVLSQSGRTAYTFGSCQGLEFESPAVMDVSGLEQSLSDTNAVIALTRSREGCYILTNFLWRNPMDPAPPTGSNLVNMLLASAAQAQSPVLSRDSPHPRAAYLAHLHSVMPNLFADIGELPLPSGCQRDIGSRSVVEAIQPHFPATTFQPFIDTPVADAVPASVALDDVLAADPAVEGPHTWDPERRERVDSHNRLTHQFADDQRSFNPPFHSRYDRATEQISLAKRIKVVQPGDNERSYRRATCPDLTDTFDRIWPECPNATSQALADCSERVVEEYCSRRSEVAVLNKIRQQDPDQRPTDIRLFLKQQVIKKIEKMMSDAVPGQLIHEFPLVQTLADSTYVLWLEENLLDKAPGNITFLRRLTPTQIQQRYAQRWNVNRPVTGNDYTSWDQGCNETILVLDVHIFRRCGFPEQFIEDYVSRKLHSRSYPGLLAVMQNSGDRFTWPMNSLRNAVVTITNLGYRADVQYWFNGDDFVADDDLSPTGSLTTPLLFVGKPQRGWTTVFSGWTFGAARCYYDSTSLVYRLGIAEDRGTTGDYWRSAFDLLSLCDPLDPDTANASLILSRHFQHTSPTLDTSEL